MSNDLITFNQGFLYTTNDFNKTNDFNTWKSNDLNQRYSTMTTNGFIVASNDQDRWLGTQSLDYFVSVEMYNTLL